MYAGSGEVIQYSKGLLLIAAMFQDAALIVNDWHGTDSSMSGIITYGLGRTYEFKEAKAATAALGP
jgi:hypothetical protein